MTPITAIRPIEAPRAVPCLVRGCNEPRAKDSDRCREHRWQQWTGTPEWVRRARENALSVKDYSGTAA